MTTESSIGTDGRDSIGTDGSDPIDAVGGANPTDPPGPDGMPIVGNTVRIVREPFAFLDDLGSYGDVVRYRNAGNEVTALLHPSHVQRALVEEPDRFERYLFADQGIDFAPEGILFTDRDRWADQRGAIQPAFTMDRIRSYGETMARYAEETADGWTDGDEIAVNRAFSSLTLRILAKTLFDVEADPDRDDEPIVRAARLINERSDPRSLTMLVPDWLPTPANRRYRRGIAAYRDRVDELIEHRRERVEAGRETDDRPGDDLLSILLGASGTDGASLSETEVRDNLLTFAFAGHETTSLALTYAVLLLSQHDRVRDRLDEELDEVLDGSRPTLEDVPRLEYVDRVLTEAMRLYPPVYMLFRKATEDAVVGGYEVPAGSIVTLPQYVIHRDDRFYDDPQAFRPDRWTDEFEDQLPEYAYFPFGGGPRHCIGMRFAMLEMKLVLATIARRFEFDLLSDPEPDLAPGATLQPKADVRVRIGERP